MHVVVIPSWYSDEKNIVLGSFFKEQALALNDSGIDITVCYNEIFSIYKIYKFPEIFKTKISNKVEDGLDTYRYKNFNYLLHSHRRFSLFSKRIEKLIDRVLKDKGKIDLLHFHSCFWAGICAPYISSVFKLPYVITEHTSIRHSKQIKKSYLRYVYEAYKKANAVISVSHTLKREVLEITHRKDINVIHNFIDGNKFKIMKNLQKSKSKFVFFSLAFLVEGKGFENLIRACEILTNKGYDFLLEIGGDGYLRKKLEEYVLSKNLTNNVIFLGMLTREQVIEKMNQCDVFVLASHYETFGVVYIEALACGKPVIAVKNGGSEEIIKKNVGILVDDCDYSKLSDAMIKIMQDIKYYNGENIRKYFLENFEKDIILDKLKDVYKNCLRI